MIVPALAVWALVDGSRIGLAEVADALGCGGIVGDCGLLAAD
jgi:hypothetical protein